MIRLRCFFEFCGHKNKWKLRSWYQIRCGVIYSHCCPLLYNVVLFICFKEPPTKSHRHRFPPRAVIEKVFQFQMSTVDSQPTIPVSISHNASVSMQTTQRFAGATAFLLSSILHLLLFLWRKERGMATIRWKLMFTSRYLWHTKQGPYLRRAHSPWFVFPRCLVEHLVGENPVAAGAYLGRILQV